MIFLKKFRLKQRNFFKVGEDFQGLFFKKKNLKKKIRSIYYRIYYKKYQKKIKKKIIFSFIRGMEIFCNRVKKLRRLNHNKFVNKKNSSKEMNLRYFFSHITYSDNLVYYFKIMKKIKRTFWRLSVRKKKTSSVLNEEHGKVYLKYSKLFPMAPKKKRKIYIKKIRKKVKNFYSYKGRFYNIMYLQLYYDQIKLNKLRKFIIKNKKKYNYAKTFVFDLEFKLFTFFHKLNFFYTLKQNLNFIKKYGIYINNHLIKNPNYIIKINDIVTFHKNQKKLFKYYFKKNKLFIQFLLNILPFNLLFNMRTLSFILLKKNLNRLKISHFRNLTKKKTFINSQLFIKSLKFVRRR